jgi:hypothetical protein
MAARSKDRISRRRRRARQRILGAVVVAFGILLWGVAATVHLKPPGNFIGIIIGGAAVVGRIILFATTL